MRLLTAVSLVRVQQGEFWLHGQAVKTGAGFIYRREWINLSDTFCIYSFSYVLLRLKPRLAVPSSAPSRAPLLRFTTAYPVPLVRAQSRSRCPFGQGPALYAQLGPSEPQGWPDMPRAPLSGELAAKQTERFASHAALSGGAGSAPALNGERAHLIFSFSRSPQCSRPRPAVPDGGGIPRRWWQSGGQLSARRGRWARPRRTPAR